MKASFRPAGFSMIEVVVAISFFAVIISVFSLTLFSVTLQERSLDRSLASTFALSQLEALESVPFDALALTAGRAFYGFGYNHGRAEIFQNSSAPTAPNVVRLLPGTAIDQGITSIALLKPVYPKEIRFLSYIFISSVSQPGWQMGPVFLYQDHLNYHQVKATDTSLEIVQVQNGIEQTLLIAPPLISSNEWHAIEITHSPGTYTVTVDGIPLGGVLDDGPDSSRLGFLSKGATVSHIDDIEIEGASGLELFDFQDQAPTEFPGGFLQAAPNDLRQLEHEVTVANYASQSSLKLITSRVEWSTGSGSHIYEVSTVITDTYEPEV